MHRFAAEIHLAFLKEGFETEEEALLDNEGIVGVGFFVKVSI